LARSNDLLPGVNVIGFLTAQVGLGTSARALLDALDQARIPRSAVSLPHPFAPDNERRPGKDFEAPYDVNVVCGTPDLPLAVAKDSGNEIFQDRYNIGLFFWEAQEFRGHIGWGMRFIDEIWASSRYIADAVRPVFDGPVNLFPHPVGFPQIREPLSRLDLGLPAGFLFLFVFDYTSSFPRKNPLGLVEAFKRAFRSKEEVALAIKSIYGDRRLLERERLWFAATDRPDIILLEGMWPLDRKNALMAACDCYVSLHRSEGLGLTMAEAMILGKPVIATAYSGNIDFMTEENSYWVRYRMTKVGRDVEPYDPEWEWADPDIDHAAELMRHVFENRDEAAARGAKAREYVLRQHSVARAADFVKERLDEIRRTPAAAVAQVTQESTAESSDDEQETQIDAELELERRARDLIERGPDPTQPTRFGFIGRLIRRIILLLLRHYDRHQRDVQRSILDAVREVGSRHQRSGE
jgi:glycosyltransferase involved in cell wall biosynthesis